MITDVLRDRLLRELQDTRDQGLFKVERPIAGAQGAWVQLADGRRVLNMCANNYLNLSSHPDVVAAARQALEQWGYGMSSVRFICRTQTVHTHLEETIASFLGTEAAILYSSCFDANGGLFETLLGPEDAVVSDALNHASVIDGIRLCKARRYRYRNCGMADLEEKLKEAHGARTIMIATDGVFSMDGVIAPLADICALAERYGALVMVDDSHALGVLGEHGRGTPEHHGVGARVDIVTGTLGKALGGASGGFTSGSREVVELLRQRSRPYLFSNSLAPMIASGFDCGHRRRPKVPGPARATAAQRAALPRGRGGGGVRDARGRPPDHPGHGRRGARRPADRGRAARARRLRRRVLLPGRPQRRGAHPRAGVGAA